MFLSFSCFFSLPFSFSLLEKWGVGHGSCVLINGHLKILKDRFLNSNRSYWLFSYQLSQALREMVACAIAVSHPQNPPSDRIHAAHSTTDKAVQIYGPRGEPSKGQGNQRRRTLYISEGDKSPFLQNQAKTVPRLCSFSHESRVCRKLFRPFEAQFYIKTVRPGSEILIVNDGGLSVSLTSRAHRGNEKQLPHFKDGGAGPWSRNPGGD